MREKAKDTAEDHTGIDFLRAVCPHMQTREVRPHLELEGDRAPILLGLGGELAEPLQVLDSMLAVADRIAQDLNGDVRDETRSVMTPQTIEYCRQSITEFLFKHSA